MTAGANRKRLTGNRRRDLLFLDTRGPRVASVTDSVSGQSVIDETSPTGPTPLFRSIDITFVDEPARAAGFDNAAVNLLLGTTPDNYQLVGDANGPIPIARIEIVFDGEHTVSGQTMRMTTVRLVFAAPLPDDRFTISVLDQIADDAGNLLHSEPGQSFSGRFTVDSRPELAAWNAGCVWIDANGDFTFDPQPLDPANSDIACLFGLIGDTIFAGNFSGAADGKADGFDKLAAYGCVDDQFRWLIDTNNDGLPDIDQIDAAGINGLPLAGRFDASLANGDEVGLAILSHRIRLHLVFRHRPRLPGQSGKAALQPVAGPSVVGDFNGDGLDDLGAWHDGLFQIDLAGPITPNASRGMARCVAFRFSFTGSQSRPVAADMNQDGFGSRPLPPTATVRQRLSPQRGGFSCPPTRHRCFRRIDSRSTRHPSSAHLAPVGQRSGGQFGESSALPLVGNFALPVTSLPGSSVEGTSATTFSNSSPPTRGSWVVKLNGVVQNVASM